MEQGLHITPDNLRGELQQQLDSAGEGYDAVLLGYGLCGNGTLGLSCRLPLVIPRAHDCISLLLGSRQRHEDYMRQYPGSYFYTPGWIEQGFAPSRAGDEQKRQDYIVRYGQETTDYLMETELEWRKKYQRAVFIDWGLPEKDRYIEYTQEAAAYLGWQYDYIEGSNRLLLNLLSGGWEKRSFAVLKPGQVITESILAPCRTEGSG